MKSFFLLLALFLPFLAQADTLSKENNSQSRVDWGSLKKNLKLKYSALFIGPTTQHIDGNLNGYGTYLSLRNYFSLGVVFSPQWEAEVGAEYRKYWRPQDPKQPQRASIESRDPYIGVIYKNFVDVDIFSMGAKARYFAPISENTKSYIGKRTDAGNGTLQGSISSSWKFLDGDLFISLPIDIYYHLAKSAPMEHEDFSLKAKANASYYFGKRISTSLEYSTGDLRHHTTKKWSKFNDPYTGHKVMASISWMPSRKLLLSPSISWGHPRFQLNNAELSLYTSYYFL